MTKDNKWTAQDMTDQSGKMVIVTGANSGIGYEAAQALAVVGAHVVMACRDTSKGEAAAEAIRKAGPSGSLKVMALDLADLSSVRQFSEAFTQTFTRLDILVNNAGVMAIPNRRTADGFEMQFGTNHLGHFALAGSLIDLLIHTPNSRVITVSSYAHFFGWINFKDLNGEKFYQKWVAYCQSKLANVMFAYELQRRLSRGGGNPISLAVHPGYAATDLQRYSPIFIALNRVVAQSPKMGALPTLYGATHPDICGGEYIGPDGFLAQRGYPHVARSSRHSHDEATARRLWAVSEKLTGVHFHW